MSEENNAPQQTAPAAKSAIQNNLAIPFAIVIAAALIAGAIYMNGQKAIAPSVTVQGTDTDTPAQKTPEIEVAPITASDHIKGNPNAPIVIVEYSDFDCPFCKMFHETMNKVMDKFGTDGKVAWVYRQFPIKQLHPNSSKVSEASECVAELGGNDAFWKFTDSAYASRKNVTLANGGQTIGPVDIASLPDLAVAAGVDRAQFETCLNEGRYTEAMKAAVTAASKTGAQGTPYSIVMIGDQKGVINGAQPYDVVEGIIESLITQAEADPQVQ